jgi:hypothetical protein
MLKLNDAAHGALQDQYAQVTMLYMERYIIDMLKLNNAVHGALQDQYAQVN